MFAQRKRPKKDKVKRSSLHKHNDPPQLIVNFTQQVWSENIILSVIKIENLSCLTFFGGVGELGVMKWSGNMKWFPLKTAMTLECFFSLLWFCSHLCLESRLAAIFSALACPIALSCSLSLQGPSLFRLWSMRGEEKWWSGGGVGCGDERSDAPRLDEVFTSPQTIWTEGETLREQRVGGNGLNECKIYSVEMRRWAKKETDEEIKTSSLD